MRSISLLMDISGMHLQTQKCMRNTSREQTGVPDQWKRIYHTKLGKTKELGGKTGVLVGLDLPSASGEVKHGTDPDIGATV